MRNDSRNGKSRHYPRRYLTLQQGERTVEIRCTEETVENYFGHETKGPTPEKELRFPKQFWEVAVDKTK